MPTERQGDTPFGYTGQYQDVESGLLYLRGRYYDRQTQQFISRDPLEATTGQPYAYAWGNPVNYTDPAGLWPGLGGGEQLPPEPQGTGTNPGGLPTRGGQLGYGNAEGGLPDTGYYGEAAPTIYASNVPNVKRFPSQRAARRAAMRDAGIGKHGRSEVVDEKLNEPLHDKPRSPMGDPGVRQEWISLTDIEVHHDPYGNYYAADTYLGPHYGVKYPNGTEVHYAYPSTRDPRLNR